MENKILCFKIAMNFLAVFAMATGGIMLYYSYELSHKEAPAVKGKGVCTTEGEYLVCRPGGSWRVPPSMWFPFELKKEKQ